MSQTHGRAAACLVAAIVAADAAAKLYWVLGGTWGGEPASSGADRLRVVGAAVVGLAFGAGLLIRAGYWRAHVPRAIASVVDRAAAVFVLVPLGGALNALAGTPGPDVLSGVGNLLIAALALIVVRAPTARTTTTTGAP